MDTTTYQSLDCKKSERTPYIYAVALMGLFTFLFLGAEYLFVDVLSHVISEDKTVLAQNYALGVSAVGFFLYPLSVHLRNVRLKTICAAFIALLSILCLVLIASGTSYTPIFAAGLMLFLLLGVFGSAVFFASLRRMRTDKYLARTVGVSYALGILLQFVNNNLVRSFMAQALVLSVSLLLLVLLLIRVLRTEGKAQANAADDQSAKGKSAAAFLILLVALMTCIFSTLDNAVTLVHSGGTVDIGQWPRILLAVSGLAAGFVFDMANRKYMVLVMYCVMLLSTLCIAVLKLAGPFLLGLVIFYLSAGFFAVFFTTGFMELARGMKTPTLWAGMGRAINNITAAVITNPVLLLLSSNRQLSAIVLVLVLFAAVSVVAAIYNAQRKALMESPVEAASEEEALQRLAEAFALTERETEVFARLVCTEDSLQEIAESLYISRRTLERHISAIYEKTGAKSRVGLLKLYKE